MLKQNFFKGCIKLIFLFIALTSLILISCEEESPETEPWAVDVIGFWRWEN